MALMGAMVNMQKLLANQQVAIQTHIDTKTTETKSHVTSKATDTKSNVVNLVNAETQAIDDKLASMTAVNGELDTNATAINAHVTSKVAEAESNIITGIPKTAPKMAQILGYHSAIRRKYGGTTIQNASSDLSFYTGLNGGLTALHSGAILNPQFNTERQLILNVPSGKGVLTHAMSSLAQSSGTISLFITIDGKESVYEYPSGYLKKALFGGFLQVDTFTGGTKTTGYGCENDQGWQNNPNTLMLTPSQAISEGFGIPFESSLKVEMQMGGGISGNTTYGQYAGACYVRR